MIIYERTKLHWTLQVWRVIKNELKQSGKVFKMINIERQDQSHAEGLVGDMWSTDDTKPCQLVSRDMAQKVFRVEGPWYMKLNIR